MLRKISLSAMVFTYFFAGAAHFLKTDYYLGFIPLFVPHSLFLVQLTGGIEILLAILLAIPRTRRGACYGILLLWSVSLPVNLYTVSTGGAGTPFTFWQLKALIPFHLLLMLWAFLHIRIGTQGRKTPAGEKFQSLERG